MTLEERIEAICKTKGWPVEKATTWENEGARRMHRYSACVGAFDLGAVVGTGPTPEIAIEDLCDLLEDSES